jgi:hypothetical protein
LYLAKKRIKGIYHYIIRESYEDSGILLSRDLFDLGDDPRNYIIYAGGNSFYIDAEVEERLDSEGANATADEIDDLFWPYIRPDIKRALESFWDRGKSHKSKTVLSAAEENKFLKQIHLIDKRRVHYLRCGRVEQGRIGQMPVKMLKNLFGKSRDELEQHFMNMERLLKPYELKTYVYVIFDLQRHFSEIFAKSMPQGLDQNKLDTCFLDEVCRLNRSTSFWGRKTHRHFLNEYLTRYVIMFFDNDYAPDNFLADYIKNFMNQRRSYRPPPQARKVSLDEASRALGVPRAELDAMTVRDLTRLYRRLAQKHHPDRGGEQEKFIQITEAYQGLLVRRGK